MGAVYLAEDSELGRLVALKVPHAAYREAPEVRERLLREARAAAQFRHPNFCPIHDIGEVDGIPYLGMSYIEGRTLASTIEAGHPWPQRKAAEVARRLALALAEAHRRGVIHRDLKPANVMVDHPGPSGRLPRWPGGSPWRWPRPIVGGSSTATSSPPTSWSTSGASWS
jgi:serine/threonine-protein kinase